MRLLLDTNIARVIATGEIDCRLFQAARARGITIHLSSTAAAELFKSLTTGAFSWDAWLRARSRLSEFIDRNEPIDIGSRLNLGRMGVRSVFSCPSDSEIEEALTLEAAAWRLLSRPSTYQGFLSAEERVSEGCTVSVNPVAVQQTIEAERARFIAEFEDIDAFTSKRTPELREKADRPDGAREVFADVLRALQESIDAASPQSPPLSRRFDAFFRVWALLHMRHIRRKGRYNPVKDSNDAFDHHLLRDLAIPAAICTLDKGIHADLREADCWQRRYVLTPRDLGSRGTLRSLKMFSWDEGAAQPAVADGPGPCLRSAPRP